MVLVIIIMLPLQIIMDYQYNIILQHHMLIMQINH